MKIGYPDGRAWARRPAIMRLLLGIGVLATSRGAVCGEDQSRTNSPPKYAELAAHYSFEATTNGALLVENEADRQGSLRFQDKLNRAGEPMAETLSVVNGRLPGTRAVRMDRISLVADRIALNPRSFTIVCWIRYQGRGNVRFFTTECGPIVSLGSGYSRGWRLLVDQHRVSFQLGQEPGPDPATLGAYIILNDGQWHLVAVTWDGNLLRLFVDGKSQAQTVVRNPAKPIEGPFVIGYNNYGVGSAKFELDELDVYNRTLSPTEIDNLAGLK